MSYKCGYKVSGYTFGQDEVFVYGMKRVYIILSILCCVGVIVNLIRVLKVSKVE